MLHDPKWNHGTLSGLITWLEGKPRDGTYNFSDCQNCLIAQYMDGYAREGWSEEMREIYGGRDEFKIARGSDPYIATPLHTYGAALERAYEARMASAA